MLRLTILAALAASAAFASDATPLTITSASIRVVATGSHYELQLHASGGAPPYTWHLGDQSTLPPGLTLHGHSGKITGTPSRAGEYHFTLVLSDADSPSGNVQREFTMRVIPALTIEWKRDPHVSGTWLAGSAIVTNHTESAVTLTVVVVAVNQVGRATALGYQHFELAANAEQEIPFGASPGPGSYVVHADVVADGGHVRTRKQTPPGQPLVIRNI